VGEGRGENYYTEEEIKAAKEENKSPTMDRAKPSSTIMGKITKSINNAIKKLKEK